MNNKITRTIYSVCYPPAQEVLTQLLKSSDVNEMYTSTWSKKQDSAHEAFYQTWKQWVNPRFQFTQEQLPYFYPTAGSSEAIREQIVYLASLNKRLVVFEAEYEGYEAIANSVGMSVHKINRFTNIENILNEVNKLNSEMDVIFLSQPSSIDGNVWDDFDKFMKFTQSKKIPVYLDIAYVGASRQQSTINIQEYDNVNGVFFSLSKVYGVYYHRIGGVILKQQNPLLYGNMWFKNLFSMRYGVELMQNLPIGFYDEKLDDLQAQSIKSLTQEYNVRFLVSDVFLMVSTVYNPYQEVWQKEFQRSEKNPYLRLCLSPILENIMRS